MKERYPCLPFALGAPSMVFGNDLIENVQVLAGLVNDIEIVLFHTPTLDNIPTCNQVRMLRRLGERERLTFTVHLPTSLEPASWDANRREESLRLARELCLKMGELGPEHYIVHVPVSPPTLVAVPGKYFRYEHEFAWHEWTGYTLEFLEELGELLKGPRQLLVENINYTPGFLHTFLCRGLCEFCLDLGHLELGRENVVAQLLRYKEMAPVIHLHGVVGNEEHLGLQRMPKRQVRQWLDGLCGSLFNGILTLEVFTPKDLEESIQVVLEAFGAKEPDSSAHKVQILSTQRSRV